MKDVTQAAMEAEQVVRAHQGENLLALIHELGLTQRQAQVMQTILEIGKMAGRTQTAQIFGHVADCVSVAQLRKLKEIYRQIGITWEQACKMAGVSRRTADRYLSLAAELGEEFFRYCGRIGLSVRTMEQARRLPEPVREKLTSGEVVDLERVSKEELTRVIRELAEEHAKEQAEAAEALAKEIKARERVERRLEETSERLSEVEREVRTLAEGLPPDDAEALEVLRKGERDAVMWLVRIKNTVNIAGRDPMFAARLITSLMLVAELAQATANMLQADAEGVEVDEDALLAQARSLDAQAASYDGREPYAGV